MNRGLAGGQNWKGMHNSFLGSGWGEGRDTGKAGGGGTGTAFEGEKPNW